MQEFRQVTSSTHPIRVADDFSGFKIRTQPTPIFVDLFRALGASPVPLDANELYTALQTHVADGAENPLPVIESFKMFEVQKYISLTNHIWSNTWLVANGEAWSALPSDLQIIVKANANKKDALKRHYSALLTASLTDKLQRQGIAFNECERAGMRARLGTYYAHWRTEFGPTLWSLLEGAVGKLAYDRRTRERCSVRRCSPSGSWSLLAPSTPRARGSWPGTASTASSWAARQSPAASASPME